MNNELINIRGESEEEEKRGRIPGIRLGENDYLALEFLLDQKFASLDQLFRAIWNTGKFSNFAWRRLDLMKKYHIVDSVKVHTRSCHYYMATQKAYHLLQSKYPDRFIPSPTKKIDYREFDHDDLIIESRIILQSQGLVESWKSERKLMQEALIGVTGQPREKLRLVARGRLPDATFTNKKGKCFAFEYEHTSKTKDRIDKKIKEYVLNIQSKKAPYTGVFWVVSNDRIYNLLKQSTEHHPNIFQIIKFKELKEGQ